MRRPYYLIMGFLCILIGISFTGCDTGKGGTARLLKVRIQPVFFKEDISSLRYKKAIMDQKLVKGVQKYREGAAGGGSADQNKPMGITAVANQFVDNILYSDEEWAKIVKQADEANLTLAEQICQNIETDLEAGHKYPIFFVKDDADITIEVTVTKILRGPDFSMLIADKVTYKGIKNNETKFSGGFNADESIGIETPEQVARLLAKKIAKDLKKAGLI